MTQTVVQAKTFVKQLDIPAAPPALLGETDAALDFAFDSAKEQAAMVRYNVIAFIKGVAPEQPRTS